MTMFNPISISNDSTEMSDPRMDTFLITSPLVVLSVISLYFFIIYKAGPQFMENRKPFSLRPVLIVYNIVQIICNAYVFSLVFHVYEDINFMCMNHDTSNSQSNSIFLSGHYSYILLKYLDLVETVFFVLRKKPRQVSFMHVYHHVGILLASSISGRYFPGGQGTFVALYNTATHCNMYSYYLYACWNSGYSSIWWKKYITILQTTQQILIFLSMVPSVFNVNCSYPKGLTGFFLLNVLYMTYLFVDFYKKEYLINKKISE